MNFALRIVSLMVLARLLLPSDFGLVAMVTAITGILNKFRDFGLSTVTVQRTGITEKQISALFWLNMLLGAVLCVLALLIAPILSAFYHEPRLSWITAALATGFVFNAAGVQHMALLQRQLRFTTLAKIDVLSQLGSVVVGIGMAVAGLGYWSLVGMTIMLSVFATGGAWLSAAWIPGRPQKEPEIRSMIRFGGTVTLNSVVVHIAYNIDKVLLGRVWGAASLGIYERAYQLITIPTDGLISAVGGVAFPALSKLQNDPSRLKSYFLKGYSLVLAMTLPVTIACAAFSHELIYVLLGPKWMAAAPIFRLLAPTVLVLALINPLSWLLLSTGRVVRSLKIALVLAPSLILAYLIGLPYGPSGVATAFSAMMILLAVPTIMWAIQGTMFSFKDMVNAAAPPFISAAVAAAASLGSKLIFGQYLTPILRLIIGGSVLGGVYIWMLFYIMGRKSFYMGLLQEIRVRRPSAKG